MMYVLIRRVPHGHGTHAATTLQRSLPFLLVKITTLQRSLPFLLVGVALQSHTCQGNQAQYMLGQGCQVHEIKPKAAA